MTADLESLVDCQQTLLFLLRGRRTTGDDGWSRALELLEKEAVAHATSKGSHSMGHLVVICRA